MKTLQIIGYTKDLRTNTNVVYAQVDINEYLTLVGDEFDRFAFQRRRERHKAYKRMTSDIINGALLPPITLAVNPTVVHRFSKDIESQNSQGIIKMLEHPDQIYILDGLQRTYIIKDLMDAETEFKKGQKLLLEFWFEGKIKHLIYRLIVLNSGQKPMSMRHQVELLFMTLKDELEREIKGLEIFSEKEMTRRTVAKKFHFDRIVTGYYSFMTKSPEINRENIVVQKMTEEDILEISEDELGLYYENYKKYLSIYVDLDAEIFRIYSKGENSDFRTARHWLDDENVINSFFAAISSFSVDESREKRVINSLNKLYSFLKKCKEGMDPLGIVSYSSIRQGFNPKKVNVGFATRKLLFNGFKEFFREEGDQAFSECWKISVE
jgi:hypothetical protein